MPEEGSDAGPFALLRIAKPKPLAGAVRLQFMRFESTDRSAGLEIIWWL